jgi:peptidase E
MTKFILHGGGETQRNKKHDEFFREFIKNLPEKAKVLLVYFAVEDDLVAEKHLVYEKYFRDLSAGKEIELKIASKENFIDELRWAEGVYFRGGDTYMLLDAIKEYPEFEEEILKKELVAGSSAGVYFLSNHSLSASRGIVYEGLGILSIKTNCHYEDNKKEEIKILDKYPGELLLLKEGEYKIIEI